MLLIYHEKYCFVVSVFIDSFEQNGTIGVGDGYDMIFTVRGAISKTLITSQ